LAFANGTFVFVYCVYAQANKAESEEAVLHNQALHLQAKLSAAQEEESLLQAELQQLRTQLSQKQFQQHIVPQALQHTQTEMSAQIHAAAALATYASAQEAELQAFKQRIHDQLEAEGGRHAVDTDETVLGIEDGSVDDVEDSSGNDSNSRGTGRLNRTNPLWSPVVINVPTRTNPNVIGGSVKRTPLRTISNNTSSNNANRGRSISVTRENKDREKDKVQPLQPASPRSLLSHPARRVPVMATASPSATGTTPSKGKGPSTAGTAMEEDEKIKVLSERIKSRLMVARV
jgi:regulator of replication initiation timing